MFEKITKTLSGLAFIKYINSLIDYVNTSDIDATRIKGQLDISNIPPAGLDNVVKVDTVTDMLALTVDDVQNGDTVMIIGVTPPVQYQVVDDTKLGTMDAFQEYAAGTATKLATARTITANLASSTAGSFDGSANITVGVTGTLPIANGGTGLTSAPSMLVNLASTTATSPLQASPRPGVTGTLPIANGGTGQTTAAGVRNALGLGNTTGAVPIANGGTGATTAAAARTALGCAPAYTYSTTDLTAGSSALTTGTLYIVYE